MIVKFKNKGNDLYIRASDLRKVSGVGQKTIEKIKEELDLKTDFDLPNKKYDVVYADPPWQYGSKMQQDADRDMKNLDEYYDQLSYLELASMNVGEIANDDSWLFLWVTNSHMDEGVNLMKWWGFEYCTVGFNWIKTYENGSRCVNPSPNTLPSWELCLIGKRGSPPKDQNNVQGYVEAERTEHSKKPNEVRKRIESLVGNDNDMIELFAREKVDRWDVWGNEVNKPEEGSGSDGD